MAGAMLDVTLDTSQIGSALEELARRLGDLTTPFNDIGEYLHPVSYTHLTLPTICSV